MVQTSAYEGSDYTANGTARAETFADKFSAEFSLSDIKQYYDSQRASNADASQANRSYAAILGDMEIVDDGSASTIESNGKLGDSYFKSGNGGQVSTSDHLSRSGWQDSGDAGRYFSTDSSGRRSTYEDVQMASASADRTSKGKPGDKSQTAPVDTGVPYLSDNDARRRVDFSTYEEQQKAKAIKDDIMAGKDVSQALNKLGRDERVQIMTILKNEMVKAPGASVIVHTNDDRSRDILITNKDGSRVRITEDSFGQPKDIQASGVGWRTALGAKDVYDQAGEVKPTTSGGSNNPVQLLRREVAPTEGNGPLGRAMRGEELSAEEWKQLEELSRRTGGKIHIIRPREK